MKIEISFEQFARAYFATHCRKDSGLAWDDLDCRGRDWWKHQALPMWTRCEATTEIEARSTAPTSDEAAG